MTCLEAAGHTMASNEQIRVWLAVLRGVFVAASITLLLVCVLSGVQPGWLGDCYLVKVGPHACDTRG
jgi:hypothetical protein